MTETTYTPKTEARLEETQVPVEGASFAELPALADTRLRLALKAAHLGMWERDLVQDTEYWSEELRRMFGYPPIAGFYPASDWLTAIHPDDRRAAERRYAEALLSEDEYTNEYRILLPDGKTVRWMIAQGMVLRDDTGKSVRVIGACRDITEEKDSVRQLRTSEARYRALVNAASQIVWTNTPQGEMRGPQPGWSDFTGQSEEEVQGYGWSHAVHPEDATPTISAWNECVRTRTPFIFSHRVRRRDGIWCLFSIRAVPILEEDGVTIREWVGIHTDITEQQALEADREQALAQLSAVLRGATDGIIVSDPQGNILMINPAGLAMHEFDSEAETLRSTQLLREFFVLSLPDGMTIPPADRPFARLMRGEVFTNLECLVHNKKTGKEWWASYSGSPAKDRNGNTILLVVTVRDITGRKQMETQRDTLLDRIEEAGERQRRFLREMLSSMSEGRLRLCESSEDLPAPLSPLPFAEPIVLDRRSIRVLRQQTIAACTESGLPSDRENDLVTAVGEAAMNAVVHAGGGIGTIYANRASGIVQIWVHDTGTGINEDSLHRATLEKGFTTAGTLGHGFWMMLKAADRVYLFTSTSGTTIVVEQERVPPVPAWMQSFVDAS